MFPYDRECLEKFGERLGQSVWEAVNLVFDCMPLAAIVDERVGIYSNYTHCYQYSKIE